MSRKTTSLKLEDGDFEFLSSLIRQRRIQASVVRRAHILLDRANAMSIRAIAARYEISTATVQLCIRKYLEGGRDAALFDDKRHGRPVEISDEAIVWIIGLSSKSPRECGVQSDSWTLKDLHGYVQSHACEAGFPRLETITKPRIRQLLDQAFHKQPESLLYFCEKEKLNGREEKEIFLIEFFLEFEACSAGFRAIRSRHDTVREKKADSERVLFLLGIDLDCGRCFLQVCEGEKTEGFISLLKKFLDYSKEGGLMRVYYGNTGILSFVEVKNFLAVRQKDCISFSDPKQKKMLDLLGRLFLSYMDLILEELCCGSKEELLSCLSDRFPGSV